MVQTDSVDKEKILVICGPTCVGKSDFAVDAAKKYDGEIIGVDSVQVYKLLDIGSGKITREEMRGVPHYLIDVKMPDESFSVVDFLNEAKPLITDIISRGKLPIIVGGTGILYQRAPARIQMRRLGAGQTAAHKTQKNGSAPRRRRALRCAVTHRARTEIRKGGSFQDGTKIRAGDDSACTASI